MQIYTTMTSFSMIFPFFLMESVGMSASSTATCMSVQSVADLVSRLLLPQVMSRRLCGSPRGTPSGPPPGGGEDGGGISRGAGLAARTVMLIGALGSAASRSGKMAGSLKRCLIATAEQHSNNQDQFY